MASIELRGATDAGQLEELAPILSWAFGRTPAEVLKWLQDAGLEHVRLAYSGARLAAGLVEIPMGQWFGGRSVPMLGIAGVGTAPDVRGKGHALAMMREVLTQARARGVALSGLYPATVTLYRKAGYELAGVCCRWTLRVAECPRPASDLELIAETPAHQPLTEELYRQVARERPGYLDRGPYIWNRVRMPRSEPARVLLVEGAAGFEGYLAVVQQRGGSVYHDLTLSDLVAHTPRAMDRMLRFLADHRALVNQASWFGGAADGRLFSFPERAFKVEIDGYWMLRLVDVASALRARGYPDVSAELELVVEDDVLVANGGRYHLRVRDGVAEVETGARGGSRAPAIDVRALAALYTGFVHPAELVRAGRLPAEPRLLSTLALLFGGPQPAMVEWF